MSRVERLRRLTKLSLLRVRRAASPLHMVEALEDISDYGDEHADSLAPGVLSAIMGIDSMAAISEGEMLEESRAQALSMLRRVEDSLSLEALEVDEFGVQRHLRIPVNSRGEGPADMSETVALVCWCDHRNACSVLPAQEIARW